MLSSPAAPPWSAGLLAQETPTEVPSIIEEGPELIEPVQQACGVVDPGPFCTWVFNTLGWDWLARLAGVIVPSLLKILLIVFIAYIANRLMRRAIKRFVTNLQTDALTKLGALGRRAPLADTGPMDLARASLRAETVAGVLRSIATFLIWAIAAVMILGVFRINLGPLIASAGIAGVALGFGAQSLVKDFLSGLFMLLEDQYGVGDIVNLGEASGVVEGITLRSTRVRDVYGTVWHVPNGEIRRVGNMSQQWARSLVDVAVAYDTDIPFAISVIKRVADDLWRDPEWSDMILEEPDVWGVENLGPNEIVIRLVVKTVPSRQFQVNRQMRQRLKAEFDRVGIEIPFPQRQIWIRHEDDGAVDGDDGTRVTAPKQSGNRRDTPGS